MTKRALQWCKNEYAVAFAFLFTTVVFFAPSYSFAEYIENFQSSITVGTDGTFQVTEEITYVFTEAKHGIFREIPLRHPEAASSPIKRRVIDVSLREIRLNGADVPFELESSGSEFKVRIGDPDETVTGRQIYRISYVVGGGLSYPKGAGTELYFNVTGNSWKVPIYRAEAIVRESVTGLLRDERACYRGLSEAHGSCDIEFSDERVVSFSATELSPGEGMTIAQALDHSRVTKDVREEVRTEWFLIPLVLIGLAWGGLRAYRYKTEHKTGRTIIAEYEPYPGVKPMYAGLLMDKQLDPRDITAGVVYLAQQGYLKIRHLERKVLFVFDVDDYEITLTRSIADCKGSFEEELLILLFDAHDAPVGKTVSLYDLKNNHAEAQENHRILEALRERMRIDLKEQGFFASFNFTLLVQPKVIGGFIIASVLLWFFSSVAILFFIIGLVILFIVVADGRRTRKGYEALDHLKGFKDFLAVTDTERFAFHNAPKRNAEQFMKYLPYAIAFGVEKEWATAFEGITIPNPAWYDGGTGLRTFSAVSMANSLGAFSTSLASSGTSASAGGGSSGGGSGGGGGGSW